MPVQRRVSVEAVQGGEFRARADGRTARCFQIHTPVEHPSDEFRITELLQHKHTEASGHYILMHCLLLEIDG